MAVMSDFITDMNVGAGFKPALSDKSSRDPVLVKLYQEHDFLTAYAKHTDLRVKQDPHQAIGGLWEEYGILQRDFLIAQGLRPEHRLLEVGCGTGRLARQVVPYLDDRNYFGVEISLQALQHAEQLARAEGWRIKHPVFISGEVDQFSFKDGFHYAWAFSVFIHLPSDIVARIMRAVAERLTPGGKFLFSYVPTDLPDNTRTGLKQFKHPFSFYEQVARRFGYSLKEVKWPGRQRIAVMG